MALATAMTTPARAIRPAASPSREALTTSHDARASKNTDIAS